MNDKDFIKRLAMISDPYEILDEIVKNQDYMGSDPYYRELSTALLDTAERIVKNRHNPPEFEWKDLDANTERASVPGGWLVRTGNQDDQGYNVYYSITFLPDPRHEWLGDVFKQRPFVDNEQL